MNSSLEEIWSARASITLQCNNSIEELIAYYQERQKEHQDRLVRPEKQQIINPDNKNNAYACQV
ncbi:MAG: hypothetical protein ACOVSW_00190 [Candidatus Kapaibacteriota bacterium]|jgi:hypothetical protein